jgi:hypothetical protein
MLEAENNLDLSLTYVKYLIAEAQKQKASWPGRPEGRLPHVIGGILYKFLNVRIVKSEEGEPPSIYPSDHSRLNESEQARVYDVALIHHMPMGM